MPRTTRSSLGGVCYHVINRGNDRRDVFHTDDDFGSFLKAIAHACVEVPMDVIGYCLMTNHFHLVVRPLADGELSTWMHWLQNTHVRRYHKFHASSGHLWQGRFKSFPVEDDDHLLKVLRYVERNPLRAGIVRSADRWRWSSMRSWSHPAERPSWLVEGPVQRPRDWLTIVNAAQSPSEVESLRRSIARGTPFGGDAWIRQSAIQHGLESTLRPRGRPPKINTKK